MCTIMGMIVAWGCSSVSTLRPTPMGSASLPPPLVRAFLLLLSAFVLS